MLQLGRSNPTILFVIVILMLRFSTSLRLHRDIYDKVLGPQCSNIIGITSNCICKKDSNTVLTMFDRVDYPKCGAPPIAGCFITDGYISDAVFVTEHSSTIRKLKLLPQFCRYVRSIMVWNTESNGTRGIWNDVTSFALDHFKLVIDSKLHILNLNTGVWQGQLVKIQYNCKKQCTLLKIKGYITYPFDIHALSRKEITTMASVTTTGSVPPMTSLTSVTSRASVAFVTSVTSLTSLIPVTSVTSLIPVTSVTSITLLTLKKSTNQYAGMKIIYYIVPLTLVIIVALFTMSYSVHRRRITKSNLGAITMANMMQENDLENPGYQQPIIHVMKGEVCKQTDESPRGYENKCFDIDFSIPHNSGVGSQNICIYAIPETAKDIGVNLPDQMVNEYEEINDDKSQVNTLYDVLGKEESINNNKDQENDYYY